jgi:hypothetical protein
VEQTLTSKRIPGAMDLRESCLGLYISFPQLNQLRFLARDLLLTVILKIGKPSVQSTLLEIRKTSRVRALS